MNIKNVFNAVCNALYSQAERERMGVDATFETIASKFQKSPDEFLYARKDDGNHKKYSWPAWFRVAEPNYLAMPDLIVRYYDVGSERFESIAWVEGVSVMPQERAIRVRHIAVTNDLVGHGLGGTLARVFRTNVAAVCDAEQIIFCESHTRYEEAGYPAFFAALGAVERSCRTWHWEIVRLSPVGTYETNRGSS